jgi:voltage-gated potassium channel Kch
VRGAALDASGSLVSVYRRRRFALLFFSVLLTLVGNPLLDAVGADLDLLQVFLGLNLLSAILSGLVDGHVRTLAALTALFVVARVVFAGLGNPVVLSASEAVWATAGVVACTAMLHFVLREGAVDSERIYAALGVYLLAGLVFGVAYHVLEGIAPGSLRVTSGDGATGESAGLERAIYFSLVTLATLGYGDVVPASPLARALATLEAVGAQLYVAVLIARLVSLQARSPSDDDRPPPKDVPG